MSLPVIHRDALESDRALVMSSWLRSYRESDDSNRIADEVFYAGQRRVIDRILARPDTAVRVSCNPEDTDTCYGWICASGSVLHYVYTKQPFRHMGVAAGLLEASGFASGALRVTHWTYAIAEMAKRGRPVIYDPYLLMEDA